MPTTTQTEQTDARIARYLDDAGYSAEQIARGLAYADAEGATDANERLSLALSRLLYDDAQLADGARYEDTLPDATDAATEALTSPTYQVTVVRLTLVSETLLREESEAVFDPPVWEPASAYDAAITDVQAGDRLWIDAEPARYSDTARQLVREALWRRGLDLDRTARVPAASYVVSVRASSAEGA